MEKVLLKLKVNPFSSSSYWSTFKARSSLQLLSLQDKSTPIWPVFAWCQRDRIGHARARFFEQWLVPSRFEGLLMVRATSGPPGHEERAQNPPTRKIDDGEPDHQQVPDPPKFSYSTWARWVGSVLTILLSFLWGSKQKRIEGEAEAVIEGVEKVAAVVEKVATVAEKVSEEVAESIPDNGSKMKEAATWVGEASKATAQEAKLTQDLIHKVDAIERDVTDLENVVEPIIEKIVGGGSKGNQ